MCDEAEEQAQYWSAAYDELKEYISKARDALAMKDYLLVNEILIDAEKHEVCGP